MQRRWLPCSSKTCMVMMRRRVKAVTITTTWRKQERRNSKRSLSRKVMSLRVRLIALTRVAIVLRSRQRRVKTST